MTWTTDNKKNYRKFECVSCVYEGGEDCCFCKDGEYFDFKEDEQEGKSPPSQKRSLKRVPSRYKWGGPKYNDGYGIEEQLTDLEYERRFWKEVDEPQKQSDYFPVYGDDGYEEY